MKRLPILDPTRLNGFAIVAVLGILAAILLPAVLDVGEDADLTACRARGKNLITLLNRYKDRYGRYPQEDGAAFIAHTYYVDMAQEPLMLKCPGAGAANDRPPNIEKLRPFIGAIERRDNYDERPRKWGPNQISYTGPFNADPDDGALKPDGGARWRLDHLESPSVEERELARDEKYPVKSSSSLPLVADDDDNPRNHEGGYNVGFADMHVELREVWEKDKWPFAALVRDVPGARK